MKQLTEKLAVYFPWLGLICLIGGLIIFYITRQWDLLTNLTLALGVLFLLLYALLKPDEVRQLMSGRTAQYGISTLLSILFFVAIFVIGYTVAFQNSDWRYDATETDEFTPLPETIAVLESLDEPVHVIGFFTDQALFQQQAAKNQLESMKAINDDFSYEFVDPNENPLVAEQYELAFDYTLVFTKGDNPFSKASPPINERSLHSALVQVINPSEKKAYFITGHGERDSIDGGPEGLTTAVTLIKESGFATDTLLLSTVSEIPADATVLISIDQQDFISQEEFDLIQGFLDNGGSLFVARDAIDNEARARLETGPDLLGDFLAESWGVDFRADAIVEQTFSQAGQTVGLSFLGANYGNSIITQNDLDRFGTLFSVARSLDTSSETEGIDRIDLITTSDQAWGETDFVGLSNGIAEPNEGVDAIGNLTLAVSAENRSTTGKIVVLGDTDFLSNALVAQNGGNALFFSNALNWLADDELAVELTQRETIIRQLAITQSQLGFVQFLAVCLGPLLAAIAGIVVWYSRRKRR